MPSLTFKGCTYPVKQGQTVLEALEAQGVKVPYSCRVGLCQSCLMKAQAPVPSLSQRGLKESQCQQHYFLACQCVPSDDMTLALPGDQNTIKAKVQWVGEADLGLSIDVPWLSGQHISWQGQPYSLTRQKGSDLAYIAAQGVQLGDWLDVSVPEGQCCYQKTMDSDNPMIIVSQVQAANIASGIVLDALLQGHTQGLTLYTENVNQPESPGVTIHCNPNIINQVTADVARKDATVLLLGEPSFIGQLQRHFFFAGINSTRIRTLRVPAKAIGAD